PDGRVIGAARPGRAGAEVGARLRGFDAAAARRRGVPNRRLSHRPRCAALAPGYPTVGRSGP
ncbi:hypothetical protein PV379_34375, partial [Streptomyces caniscabiei]|uniref:hypothetical protein n=1 Tax=Streptomyces caniscabiei TaxID=2746961 RepID=UPI0029A33822